MNNQLKTISLRNGSGMVVELLNFGARISSIKFPVKDQLEEMTVKYQNPEGFLMDSYYLGATCGPVSNRISNAQFSIDNIHYSVSANSGKNTLHGGEKNFSNCFWKIDDTRQDDNLVKFVLELNDLEDGFPGKRVFTVEYSLSEDNEIEIVYTGISDKATPMNMTNHTYFSLGHTSCLSHSLKVSSSSFLARFDDGVPTGDICSTQVFCKNMRDKNKIGDMVKNTDHEQVIEENGFDHSFILDNSTFDKPKIELFSNVNGVKLSAYTDQATVHVYTGNYLSDAFDPQQGVCFECQGYVDAPNQASFASITVLPTQTYKSRTVYKFEIN